MPARIASLLLFIVMNVFLLGQEKKPYFEENELLSRELELARSSSLYFILNLKEKSLHLKAKGVLLRKWDIEKVRFWGKPFSIKLVTIEKRSAFNPPQRKKIQPGENQAQKDSFELEALELQDMPTSFSLVLGDNISLAVRSRARSFIEKTASLWEVFKWYTYPPLKTTWKALRKKSFTQIKIILSEKKETQAIYWAFAEGLKGVIFFSK